MLHALIYLWHVWCAGFGALGALWVGVFFADSAWRVWRRLRRPFS